MPDYRITESERDGLIQSLGDAANILAGLPEIVEEPPPDPDPDPPPEISIAMSVVGGEVIATATGDVDSLKLYIDGTLVDTDPGTQYGNELRHPIGNLGPGEYALYVEAVVAGIVVAEAGMSYVVEGDPEPPPDPDPDPDPPPAILPDINGNAVPGGHYIEPGIIPVGPLNSIPSQGFGRFTEKSWQNGDFEIVEESGKRLLRVHIRPGSDPWSDGSRAETLAYEDGWAHGYAYYLGMRIRVPSSYTERGGIMQHHSGSGSPEVYAQFTCQQGIEQHFNDGVGRERWALNGLDLGPVRYDEWQTVIFAIELDNSPSLVWGQVDDNPPKQQLTNTLTSGTNPKPRVHMGNYFWDNGAYGGNAAITAYYDLAKWIATSDPDELLAYLSS